MPFSTSFGAEDLGVYCRVNSRLDRAYTTIFGDGVKEERGDPSMMLSVPGPAY